MAVGPDRVAIGSIQTKINFLSLHQVWDQGDGIRQAKTASESTLIILDVSRDVSFRDILFMANKSLKILK